MTQSEEYPKRDMDSERHVVRTAKHKGEFWKPCPGTSDDYLCCGYQILTPMTGCGMYCEYCVLQVYFSHQHQTVYENFGDLEREVHHKMENVPEYRDNVVRIGTGEFADSLYQENRLGLSKKVADIFDRYDNALVEFKTKSVNISTLDKIKNPRKAVIGFSLNTPKIAERLERGTAPISERLKAARRCEEMGFNVAFHFDPIVWYNGWEGEYREVVSMIYDHIRDAESIAWCSMGGFRCMPSLKSYLKSRNNYILSKGYDVSLCDDSNIPPKQYDMSSDKNNIPLNQSYLTLFSGELILGADGKLRYPRTIRTAFYRAMDDEFKKHHPNAPLYLCMESREVWEEAGMWDRISKNTVGAGLAPALVLGEGNDLPNVSGGGKDKKNGLIALLDRRAKHILSL